MMRYLVGKRVNIIVLRLHAQFDTAYAFDLADQIGYLTHLLPVLEYI